MNTLSTETADESSRSSRGLFARIAGANRLFLITVVLPSLLSVIYFGFLASDVYVSESHFIVSTPDRKADSSSLSMLLPKASGFSHASSETYTVQDFIRSRDVLKLLDQKFGLIKTFSNPNIDAVNRYPGLDWWNDSFEDFHLYYQNKVRTPDLGRICYDTNS